MRYQNWEDRLQRKEFEAAKARHKRKNRRNSNSTQAHVLLPKACLARRATGLLVCISSSIDGLCLPKALTRARKADTAQRGAAGDANDVSEALLVEVRLKEMSQSAGGVAENNSV